ncbi:fibronectin type III domain-containing protein [Acerihabitans arboris]|uniref:Fibronectin type-III domain-containing protein n=1 Tax=Acerihabitans arboris TaxID=2691583 RepID=A0A845SK60_9GAMM|nr:fibronectin type III domain-containing protein [Acerihabitans arboris]NDL64339.1 hypothetical protein [Acerihabitans arboris]
MANSNAFYYSRPFAEPPASPTSMQISNLTATSVDPSWTPGIGGAPVAYYNVWQAAAPGYWAGQTTEPWLSLQNLIPDRAYSFQAFAVGFDGQYSDLPAGIYFNTPPLVYSSQPYYPPRPGCYPPPPYYYPPRPYYGKYNYSSW